MSQYVPITLDKVRNLRIGISASKLLQDELGMPLMSILQGFEKEFNINHMIHMIYAGLKHEDPLLSVEKVEKLLDEHSNFEDMMEVIGKATEIFFKSNKPATAGKVGK